MHLWTACNNRVVAHFCDLNLNWVWATCKRCNFKTRHFIRFLSVLASACPSVCFMCIFCVSLFLCILCTLSLSLCLFIWAKLPEINWCDVMIIGQMRPLTPFWKQFSVFTSFLWWTNDIHPLHLATAGASDSALMLTLCALQMLVLLLLLLLSSVKTQKSIFFHLQKCTGMGFIYVIVAVWSLFV